MSSLGMQTLPYFLQAQWKNPHKSLCCSLITISSSLYSDSFICYPLRNTSNVGYCWIKNLRHHIAMPECSITHTCSNPLRKNSCSSILGFLWVKQKFTVDSSTRPSWWVKEVQSNKLYATQVYKLLTKLHVYLFVCFFWITDCFDILMWDFIS